MTHIARRIAEVPDSPTFAIKALATRLAAAGHDIIDLSAGEPDFAPPAAAMEAARAAIARGANTYAPVAGTAELREAVAALYRRDHGLQVTARQVLVTHGGKQGLYNLAQCLLDPGDEAIVLSPGWVSYEPQIALAGGVAVPVVCRPEHGFQPDPDAVEAAMTKRTRFLIVNSPGNPTGCIIEADRLRAIDAAAKARGILVVSDELYRAITFGGQHAICHGTLGDTSLARTVIVDAASKTWAMTGWRVGFLLGPPDIIDACNRLQSHSTSGVCRVNEAAALEAITGPQDFLAPVLAELEERRDVLVAGLAQIDGITLDVVPDGAFYVFPRVDGLFGRVTPAGQTLENSDDVASALLELGGVAVVPGSGFGEPRCVRLSYATSLDAVRRAVTRLGEAVSTLR